MEHEWLWIAKVAIFGLFTFWGLEIILLWYQMRRYHKNNPEE